MKINEIRNVTKIYDPKFIIQNFFFDAKLFITTRFYQYETFQVMMRV